jgi:hypothetical protein
MDRRNQYGYIKSKKGGQGAHAKSRQSQYFKKKSGTGENPAQRIRPIRETKAFQIKII